MPLVTLIDYESNWKFQILDNFQTILAARGDERYRLELIVVNDGSIDHSAQKIACAGAADARLLHCILIFTCDFDKEAAILDCVAHARSASLVLLDDNVESVQPRHLSLDRSKWHARVFPLRRAPA